MKSGILLAIALCLGLSGCGNDTESFAMMKSARTSIGERLPGGREKAASPALTRAALSKVLTPVQSVIREKTGQRAFVARVADNNGIETWSTVDKVTLSLRQGVLVATRGFGEDLMAAEVPGPATLAGPGAGHARAHTLLDGLDQPVRTSYACNITGRSPQDIVVVEINYKTTHVTETCLAKDRTFTNEYWFDSSGRLRKSRQWVSPNVGYLLIEDLRR